MKLLAFDPGVHLVGWASFLDGVLVRVGLVRGVSRTELSHAIYERGFGGTDTDEAVIEIPQVYAQRGRKGDANDLIAVAVTVGQIVQELAETKIKFVRPREWAGQVPKEIRARRSQALLSREELEVLSAVDAPASLRHNVIDAVGIGLWRLGRKHGV